MLSDFLKNYGGYILTGLSCLITLITFIFKNKSNNNTKKIFRILSVLPAIITEAENVFKDVSKSGSSKLSYVLAMVRNICLEVGLSFDYDFWVNKVEGCLSCPQSKKYIKSEVKKDETN